MSGLAGAPEYFVVLIFRSLVSDFCRGSSRDVIGARRREEVRGRCLVG